MAVEPIDLATVKTHLRLDPLDPGEDAYLSALVTAARRACELRINRSVIGSAATLEVDAFPTLLPRTPGPWALLPYPLEAWNEDALAIFLPGGQVASVQSIAYLDPAGTAQQVAAGDWRLDANVRPARLTPVTNWPSAHPVSPQIVVSYTISPLAADDLAVVCQAMLLLIEGWYSHRSGIAVDTRGVPTEVPLAVTWLLNPLRQFGSS